MNKKEFMDKLKNSLLESGISDIDDILNEYEEHFLFKMADGFSEEEVSLKLGDPKELAKQFVQEAPVIKVKKKNRFFTGLGLGFLDIFVGCIFLVLFIGVIALAAVAISSATAGVLLITKMNIASLLPVMPYKSAVMFSVGLIALAILVFITVVYGFLWFKQLLVSYSRFHKNCMAKASNKAVYPAKATFLQVSGKLKRTLRGTILVSLVIFLVAFIGGYAVSALEAKALEFWHVWEWFQ
ncbi:MAG: DUF1700 domain-containing protein [Clostridia bacterium]|nr:DUF1700 domain-containing protein [Clostridia bacterium]MDD3971746.1 DUF1700 domain-containing protein [Clostridia bacterium]MDD4542208.1 DUF1700 domain-containing protein [Clostridia bacterium]